VPDRVGHPASAGRNVPGSPQDVDEEDMAYQPTLVVFSGGTAFNNIAGAWVKTPHAKAA